MDEEKKCFFLDETTHWQIKELVLSGYLPLPVVGNGILVLGSEKI